jgi:hypothetical protein
MSNEYMLQLNKRLCEKTYGEPPRQLSPSTADAYIKTLFTLNDKKPFKNLSFLKKTDVVMEKLGKYAESTQKTLLASIASVLSLEKEKASYKKTYKFYYDKMMGKAAEAKKVDTTEKTESQEANWIEWTDVLKKRFELAPDPTKLLHYLVLSLFTEIPPRRNQDYLGMVVHKLLKKEKAEDLPKDKNYLLIVDKKPSFFLFNVYKTAKTYGQQKVEIPESLAEVITTYLAKLGKQPKDHPFLQYEDKTSFTQPNAITRILNSVFGKKVGSSMLRHSYLTSKYNISDMKDDAEAMGHSLAEQKTYMKQPSPQSSPPDTSAPQ